MCRLPKRRLRGTLTFKRAINQFSKVNPLFAIRALFQLRVACQSRAFGSEGFPASAATGSAGDRRSLTNRHVAELARRPAFASINLPVKNNSCADALFDQ